MLATTAAALAKEQPQRQPQPRPRASVLVSGQKGIYGLATDGEHLVWHNHAGDLVGVFTHGGPVRLIAEAQGGSGPLTLAAGYAYFKSTAGAFLAVKLR